MRPARSEASLSSGRSTAPVGGQGQDLDGPSDAEEVGGMRRFLLFVVVSCIAASVVRSLWPSQLADYLALFHEHASVNSGVVVTALGLLALLLAALRVRLWRSQRDLARMRRGLLEQPPPVLAYPPASWGSRPAR